MFQFFDQGGRKLGLDMNTSKTEPHSLHGAAPVTIKSASGATLSTHTPQRTPHTHYKYLGVFFFTEPNPVLLYELLQNEIISFFNSLSHIYLSVHELVLITNLLLISKLNYCLLAHDLPSQCLHALQHRIWKAIAIKAKLSLSTSPKHKHSPCTLGGLGLWDLPTTVYKSVVNGAIRHLLLDSPPSAHHSVIRAYFSPTPNPLQDRLVDTAHALKLEAHGFGVWNPVLVQNLQPAQTIYFQLTENLVTRHCEVHVSFFSHGLHPTW